MRILITLLVIAPFSLADDKAKAGKEHPYAKSKVGDWISYKTTSGATVITNKQTVVGKTDDQVTLKIESKFGEQEHSQETKVDLKKFFDPLNPEPVNGVKPQVKKLGEGKEKITVGGKAYDCTWLHLQTIIDVSGTK